MDELSEVVSKAKSIVKKDVRKVVVLINFEKKMSLNQDYGQLVSIETIVWPKVQTEI
jgi:hypothetical protein